MKFKIINLEFYCLFFIFRKYKKNPLHFKEKKNNNQGSKVKYSPLTSAFLFLLHRLLFSSCTRTIFQLGQ